MTRWTGPREGDLLADGITLANPVPPERWPFGSEFDHHCHCNLSRGGLYCDCDASAEEGED